MKKPQTKHILNTILIIILILFFASIILNRPPTNLDEAWNYSFAKNIADGLIPYKDFNMVTTPLTAILCGIFLKFANELITMRILAVILGLGIVVMMYNVLKTIKIDRYIAYICLMGIVWLMKDNLVIDYNFLVLLFALMIVLLEIKAREKLVESLNVSFKADLIIGVLAGLAIITKQSTGLIIATAVMGYKLLEIENLGQFKIFLKTFVFRMLGVILPVVVLVVYLLINNALSDFIDYAIMGVGTFSNSVPYMKLIMGDNVLYKILSIGIPLIMVVLFLIGVIRKDKISLILGVFGIASFVVVFPISDKQHFTIGMIITLLGLIYLIKCILQYKKWEKRESVIAKISASIPIILAIIIAGFSIQDLSKYVKQVKSQDYVSNHYKYIPMTEGFYEDINNIIDYINAQDKDVYIIDAQAVIYRLPMDKYYKNYDLFLKGNLGSGGVEDQIKDLKTKQNILVLIKPNGYNWQFPIEMIEYVKTNMNKIGNIGVFEIYSK